LPCLVVAGLTPLLSLTSFTSTSSFVPKLPKNVLPTFNITIRVDLDVFKAFLGAFLAFLAIVIALRAFIASILAYALASRVT
jgi:hypothetical protein